ncbi:MAG: hypothetical protein AAF557_20315 [Pseudomonadota bacterium]
MMYRSLLAVTLLLTATVQSTAEEERKALTVGGDSFLAGQEVIFDQAGKEDLFAAGEIIRVLEDITGSAHLAGRKIKMTGRIGGHAYLAGMDVVLEGPVRGNATLAGYDVTVAAVGGNLRVSGGNLLVQGPVGGYALISGETAHIDAQIAGDAIITSRELTFADNTQINGKLILFEETPGTLEVPQGVATADRIERRDISEWKETARDLEFWNWKAVLGRFLAGIIVIGALATLVAAVIPKTMSELREDLLKRPFRNLLFGFLTQSIFIGAAVILLLTVIGILASPAAILAALIAGLVGYVVAVYAFGVGLLLAFGRSVPTTIATRSLAAGLGAVVAGIIALIPLLGWLFIIVFVLAGVGAVTLKTLRPAFFVERNQADGV